ncbi:DNA polymerase III subunit beta [Legionella pneumophila]|uniref:Beta sliding clamp n=1 Tax=Legionella pneumophila subsp. pascullei TaxID=91890 RepID=A0AAX2ISY5_LEGPN|nr:DNA polymerase III subunit beta [Legionella pneumophila]AMP88173.1 DNA polymerase III subunit beta [Legionella pneumophila subsp. pascullei]AMP91081.1 DNA polymerase III subunit beta [Legionella pneumophila subsp. pascullei]AMP94068.1 DNA polymerase III subunit beta [Legionella pneumophila subsp. pascullei]SQG88839.1 DNA polymerase III subunit beta [Legionella pneumophila subsp. pascullei]VEH03889.1 DNA polymerase III subunit beta [Legionella pneumophila subsp. pascullei]
MFELTIKKEELITPLLTVSGAVDKKQSLAILSHFLLKLSDGLLFITATDLEIEISAQVACDSKQTSGSITVPAKKFIDIIRSLDENTSPSIVFDKSLVTIKQNRSTFKLATLPSENYPTSEDECNDVELTIPRLVLLQLLQSTHFAMSQQDVRIFLNGLLLEFDSNLISAVATDGHRMAISRYSCNSIAQAKLLLPKKGVQELLRLLNCINDDQVLLAAGKSHIKLITNQFVFLSKLIEARFPPYTKAIPREQDKHIIIDCATLKRALSRIVILAHEKSKAVLLHLQPGQLTLIANNNEQEEAIETLNAETQGDELKIGLNATYLLDVLSHFSEGQIKLSMSTTDSSILIESLVNDNYQYIIMPMKI